MKPLIILLVSFGLVIGITWLSAGSPQWATAGNWAMMVMLMFTGAAHFKFPEGMARMIPVFIPAKVFLVYATGVMEIVAGVLLLFPLTRVFAAIFLVVLFVSILPANISAALRKIDFTTNENEGNGPAYLWFRIPLQVFFIAWICWFGIYAA